MIKGDNPTFKKNGENTSVYYKKKINKLRISKKDEQ